MEMHPVATVRDRSADPSVDQHPPPGTEGRPSYTAVLGSVDSLASKYVATHRAQTSKREIIEDMQEMTEVSQNLPSFDLNEFAEAA